MATASARFLAARRFALLLIAPSCGAGAGVGAGALAADCGTQKATRYRTYALTPRVHAMGALHAKLHLWGFLLFLMFLILVLVLVIILIVLVVRIIVTDVIVLRKILQRSSLFPPA